MHQKIVEGYAGVHSLTVEGAREEIHRILVEVATVIAPRYVFGYHTVDDVVNTAVVLGLEALETDKYDVERPLANFLYTHMHNRLQNEKRKTFMRSEAPCGCCNAFDPGENPCQKWKDWAARNASKQNLMKPVDMSIVNESHSVQHDLMDDIVLNDLLRKIDEKLPLELRSDYLRMRDNVMIPKLRRQKVREAVLEIIRG